MSIKDFINKYVFEITSVIFLAIGLGFFTFSIIVFNVENAKAIEYQTIKDSEEEMTDDITLECVDKEQQVVEIQDTTQEDTNQIDEQTEEMVENICYDYYEPESYYASYDYNYYENGSGLTPSSGVNYYNGYKETYYSSNQLYHYKTSEWTIGDDGVYRDSDGYVIIASSDYDQGTVLETSFGESKVYDTGCASGVIDVYTCW